MDPKTLFMLQNMIQPQPDQQPINPMMLGMMGGSQPMPQPQYEQQQMPPQATQESPLMRGAQSARQAVSLNDEQQRRATGMAMMKFFSNMSKTGYGNGINGTLSRINASFLPAAEEYWRQNDQSMAQNQEEAQMRAAEMRRAEDIELANQKEAMQQDRWEREFEEKQRAHKANEDYRNIDRLRGGKLSATERKELKKEENIEKALAQDAISFDTYTPAALTKVQNEMNSEIKNAGVYSQTIDVVNKMREIFNEHPDIGDSWVQLLNTDDKPSFFSVIARKFGDKNKIAALEKLAKYQATLNLDVIFGKTGIRPTDMLKKLIQNSNPGGRLTHEAAMKLFKDIEDIAEKKRKNIPIYVNSLKKRMVLPTYDVQDIYNKYGLQSDSPLDESTHISTESKAQSSNSMDEDELELQRIDEELRKKQGVS